MHHQLFIWNLSLPLELAAALSDHGHKVALVLHPLLEGDGELLGSDLTDVHGKDNQVEVPGNDEKL
jgi:hypothetical protein